MCLCSLSVRSRRKHLQDADLIVMTAHSGILSRLLCAATAVVDAKMAADIADGEEGGGEDWSVLDTVLEDEEEAAPVLTPDQLQKALAAHILPHPPLSHCPMLELLHLP